MSVFRYRQCRKAFLSCCFGVFAIVCFFVWFLFSGGHKKINLPPPPPPPFKPHRIQHRAAASTAPPVGCQTNCWRKGASTLDANSPVLSLIVQPFRHDGKGGNSISPLSAGVLSVSVSLCLSVSLSLSLSPSLPLWKEAETGDKQRYLRNYPLTQNHHHHHPYNL